MDQYLGRGSDQSSGTDLRGLWPNENHIVERASDLAAIAAWPKPSDIVFTFGKDGLDEFHEAQERRKLAQSKTAPIIDIVVNP